eukprot:scaffold281631_cov19-Tisochrysis_lutea.AAC.1
MSFCTASGGWELQVAQGATARCGALASTEWSVCGVPLATGAIPVDLRLPLPVSLALTPSAARLAPAGDDATVAP